MALFKDRGEFQYCMHSETLRGLVGILYQMGIRDQTFDPARTLRSAFYDGILTVGGGLIWHLILMR